MEFFVQELTLAALFTAVLYWVLAIYVPFNRSSSFDPIDGESAAKDEIFCGGLRVKASKGKKTVAFADDVAVISNVDRYGSEGLSESAASLGGGGGDVGPTEDAEKDGSVARISAEKGFDAVEAYDFDGADDGQGPEKIEMAVIEEECDDEGNNLDGALCKKDERLAASEEDDYTKFRESPEVIEGLKTSPENDVEDRGSNVDDDIVDDWEGIERSELEQKFARAVNYLEYGRKQREKGDDLGFDEQMRLYGLHKLAVEGPCFEPQPMALKVSARAKWNAWQRLGNLSPEAAMEQYVKVLTDYDPRWMHDDSENRE